MRREEMVATVRRTATWNTASVQGLGSLAGSSSACGLWSAIDRDSQLLFAPGAGLPLSLVSRESSGTACGEERCADSFWTTGVRGDAFENGC